ncbi:vWA domain-containing protein [Pleionea sediminis]|uniref:vWA domain-containing protein n=1 Tax=Pleionea sediminis TaxID=2569479 RepID=UPI0011849458|nr:von Willebrand factor type A domain-containing protein [Pleionea sediminis]
MKTNQIIKTLTAASLTVMIAACSTTSDDGPVAQTKKPQKEEPVIVTDVVVAEEAIAAETPVEVESDSEDQKVVITGSSIRGNIKEDALTAPAPQAPQTSILAEAKKRGKQSASVRKREARAEKVIVPHPELPPKFYHRNTNYQIFKAYGVNPTVLTQAEPVSTFSMDADNGSYKLALNMLKRHQLPAKEGIRVEEFINAMDYQYQPSEELFGLSAEVMPSPFRPGYHLLHLGVQTKQIDEEARKPLNLVIVADVSGSMAADNKLDMLKQAMITLVSQLRDNDKVALVTYSDGANVVIPPTEARNAQYINQSIRQLYTQGSTNAAAGLQLGYKLADQMFDAEFNNRVILTSDGMANVGSTQPEQILNQIEGYKEKGVFLTTVGVGIGMYNDHLLEQLANKGNGNYLYLSGYKDIQEAFVEKLTQNIQTVAKDAKVQVEFNTDKVSHYRLLGYENRHLNKKDFLDAKKDGGELGAGYRVTALYEVKLTDKNEDLGTLNIAYKYPMSEKVRTLKKDIPASVIRNNVLLASSDLRLSAVAAAFAEKLRQSYWSRLYSYQKIDELLVSLPATYQRKDSVQQLSMAIEQAALLDKRVDPFHEHGPISTIDIDRVPLLQ